LTATSINGVPIIAAEPAEASIRTADGQPVRFKQILKLLLEDGTEAYGCLHCDYTAPRMVQVRPHLSKHNRQRVEPAPRSEPYTPEPIDPDRLTLAEMLEAVQSARENRTETDRWKARALRAEQDLALIRRTVAGKG
jgi:hypothetical protein